jgi:hypothetical protein
MENTDMNHITRSVHFLLAPSIALLLLFSMTGYAAGNQMYSDTTSCSGLPQNLVFQTESTEGGETEGGEAEGGETEGEGEKKEEEEEPDC